MIVMHFVRNRAGSTLLCSQAYVYYVEVVTEDVKEELMGDLACRSQWPSKRLLQRRLRRWEASILRNKYESMLVQYNTRYCLRKSLNTTNDVMKEFEIRHIYGTALVADDSVLICQIYITVWPSLSAPWQALVRPN